MSLQTQFKYKKRRTRSVKTVPWTIFSLRIKIVIEIDIFCLLQIHFVTLNSSELKKAVIQHCLLWQTKLGELLRTMAEYDIDAIYSYVERSSEEAMRVIISLSKR